ncbi:DUF2085 domain-containing protein [Neobacillus sp. DY30]|uniref:DUF2085 domain-containing protein n=1 Tax=Neobacillus sp. DY30 TaxID=3047871 RepID=UPI0024C024A4|nr:DUF2085 domain-containing protein [Neobacillus sp. DY30]WHX99896.1 DUF2085 domain-containing protein [Neobacillus sp. DY30]
MLHDILHFFGRAICHQFEVRSLTVSGDVLAVCARDTGIYIGIFSTLMYLHFFKRRQPITIPSIKVSFLLLFFLVPLMADGLGSYTGLFESNNPRRLLTGISFGLVLPYFTYPLLSKKYFYHDSVPVISKIQDFIVPLVVSVLLGCLFYMGWPSHIVLDGFIIVTAIGWFSLLASFLFPFITRFKVRMFFSLLISFSFLSILSLAHAWILSFHM